ncbi:hypothetical protein SeMB42_g04857 [Synchytrium endobioticum]|uniref:Uncharacterized protein n=1 Tax=Synchytrium endobioticum TaxID=286115 RepID=A0A507CTN2_9FUNG|nr:hypothetical protein SeLEV6574_g05564 [Synchytrium endobioticum]TPX43105.1 hypothetical protein SeMB42_g04857 [Synchytrium endobioticum]
MAREESLIGRLDQEIDASLVDNPEQAIHDNFGVHVRDPRYSLPPCSLLDAIHAATSEALAAAPPPRETEVPMKPRFDEYDHEALIALGIRLQEYVQEEITREGQYVLLTDEQLAQQPTKQTLRQRWPRIPREMKRLTRVRAKIRARPPRRRSSSDEDADGDECKDGKKDTGPKNTRRQPDGEDQGLTEHITQERDEDNEDDVDVETDDDGGTKHITQKNDEDDDDEYRDGVDEYD